MAPVCTNTTKKRYPAVDLFRFVAAFGVIFIHLVPCTEDAAYLTRYFLRTSVPFFLVVAMFFLRERGAGFAGIKLGRLLYPYIAWSAIYLSLRVVKYYLSGQQVNFDFVSMLFFGGAGVQLYFIPLLICMQVVQVSASAFLARPLDVRSGCLAMASIAGIVAASSWLEETGYLGFSDGLVVKTAWYCLVAASLPPVLRSLDDRVEPAVVSMIALVAFAAATACGVAGLIRPSDFTDALGAGLLVVACLKAPFERTGRWLETLGGTTFGVYLSHHLFIEAIEFGMASLRFQITPYTTTAKLVLSSLVMVLSIGFVFAVRNVKPASFLLLGESPSRRTVMPGENGVDVIY